MAVIFNNLVNIQSYFEENKIDIIIEPRYYTTYNFTGMRVDGYEDPIAVCHIEAAKQLLAVATNLKNQGYVLKIFDAYRPQRAVSHFSRWKDNTDWSMQSHFYPGFKKSKPGTKYIANQSGHSKGGTIDLTLAKKSNGVYKELDMGSPFDMFDSISKFNSNNKNLTNTHKNNRRILRDAMTAKGFTPYVDEWWHFSIKVPNVYYDYPVSKALFP